MYSSTKENKYQSKIKRQVLFISLGLLIIVGSVSMILLSKYLDMSTALTLFFKISGGLLSLIGVALLIVPTLLNAYDKHNLEMKQAAEMQKFAAHDKKFENILKDKFINLIQDAFQIFYTSEGITVPNRLGGIEYFLEDFVKIKQQYQKKTRKS